MVDKPAAVVNGGQSQLAPSDHHCRRSAPCWHACTWPARDYPREQPNLRGLAWWNETMPVVLPHPDRRAGAS
jgi:homoserine kinase type II